MTVAQLKSDETLRRREFPVCRERIFLAHAGDCPWPARVHAAVTGYADACTRGDQESALPPRFIAETRALAARLLGCAAEEIAFVGPTSIGLGLVANGLDLAPGDNVVAYLDDYPSNVYPWMALAGRGVKVRFVQPPAPGRITLDAVAAQVDDRTRLVALASCHFLSGWRIDLDGIGAFLRERGVLFCVDGIQTLGAFPTSLKHVDFLAADAHKWLLGPLTAGILFVRREAQERLRPAFVGWHNVRCPNFVTQEVLALRPDARRYEAGSMNLLGLAGLRAAIELILDMGVEAIAGELLRQRAWLVPALLAKGWDILEAAAPPDHASGILSLHRPNTDLPALHQRLTEARIITSLRADRTGRRFIRLSPHFYNTDAELQRAVELL
jgi:selenocysteine lyase/cysteine desulfurase